MDNHAEEELYCGGNEDIPYATIPQAVEYGCPKLGTLIFANPHAENVFLAVKVDPYGDVHRFLHDLSFAADMVVDPLKETEARDLLEIVESRYKRNSTIFCSQFDIPGWPEKLSDPLLADAICDRIVHDAYTVVIGGKESMRKRKGLQDT